MRLDLFLKKNYPTYSRTYFHYLIESGAVLVNGQGAKKRILVSDEDDIEICFLATPELKLIKEPIPLDILYEDDHLIAINKPANLVVHPAPGHPSGTLVNALLYHCQSLSPDELRPGIVHRLDKDTTGVIVAAKTVKAHQELVKLFSDRNITKTYLAITQGTPKEGILSTLIGRHPTQRKLMTVVEQGGKEATSQIEVLAKNGQYALVKLTPHTGRTHQLRVHLQHLGTPILGDPIYGKGRSEATRPLLHALNLSFIHPITQTFLALNAPVPHDMRKYIATLTQGSNYEGIC
ncbi:MAG: RluA family pseudouridine synthase [Simkaniaceae bacterium]|nr:RluA family pseudouridine synthase [Simkaniaceae bacterium]